jgi:polyisoprenoid-binding protein YceI
VASRPDAPADFTDGCTESVDSVANRSKGLDVLVDMTDVPSTQQATPVLVRTVGGVEIPEAGLWNITPGWASIEVAVPRIFGRALLTRMRLKQGMIAIADDPTHSTAHLSLDAASLHTGHAARDRYLHDEVLNTNRYAAIPVRIAAIEHRGGPNWDGHGWITIGGIATPIELAITYEGMDPARCAVLFRAHASVPLRSILAGRTGLRSSFLASRHLRITIEIHAEPVRTSHHHPSRADRSTRELLHTLAPRGAMAIL